MSGYVDLHAHILPAVDDGPDDLEQSLAMARAAVASGIAIIAATPHLRPDFPGVYVHEIASRCANLSDAFAHQRIPLQVVPGAEVSLSWAVNASDEQLALASYGQRAHDLLIETPFTQIAGLDRFLYQLRAKGYRVTLGHPERNPEFQRDGALPRRLADQGVLLQLNADSLLGRGGSGAKKAANELLMEGVAHVIASDGHRGEKWRPVTRLAEAVGAAADLVGERQARWMATDVPAAIVTGSDLPAPPPPAPVRRRLGVFGHKRREEEP